MDSGQQLRLALVGCGAITEGSHLPAVLASYGMELAALCDANRSRAEMLRKRMGLNVPVFADHRQLIGQADAAIVATPNHLHAAVAVDLLTAGMHVLCEKPLASTREDCRRMVKAARSSSSILAVGYVQRFLPSTRLTHQLLRSGDLGKLHSFEYEFGTAGGWAPLSGYNLSRSTSGGGVLVVSGSHFADRMFCLFDRVSVRQFHDDSRGGVEANCIGQFDVAVGEQNFEGTVTLSKTHLLSNRLRIHAEKGVLEAREGQKGSVTLYPAGSDLRHEIHAPGGGDDDPFRVQLEDFVRAVQTRSEPMVNGEEGSKSVDLMLSCYEMAQPLEEPWVDVTLSRIATSIGQAQQLAGGVAE
ncbi:MAG: Gfo/Idh/MocA family protein [Candidatus Korobacteraceae bacterium]